MKVPPFTTNKYYMSQLSYEECLKIQIYLEDDFKARAIARKLHRSNSAISNEIKNTGLIENTMRSLPEQEGILLKH